MSFKTQTKETPTPDILKILHNFPARNTSMFLTQYSLKGECFDEIFLLEHS